MIYDLYLYWTLNVHQCSDIYGTIPSYVFQNFASKFLVWLQLNRHNFCTNTSNKFIPAKNTFFVSLQIAL